MTKTCTKCKESKLLELFSKETKSKDGRMSWCKDCCAERAAESYRNNPEFRARIARNRQKTKVATQKFLCEYLRQHPCVDCGTTDIRVLEFDHRDESLKTCNVSELLHYSTTAMMVEIEKCDVRCANCHRIRTGIQFGSWRVAFDPSLV